MKMRAVTASDASAVNAQIWTRRVPVRKRSEGGVGGPRDQWIT